jgi:hypothetical protein
MLVRPPACREVDSVRSCLPAAALDRPREPLDGRTHSEQRVHLGRLDVVVLKLALGSVLVRLGGIRAARIPHLVFAAAIRRTFNAARVPIPTGP